MKTILKFGLILILACLAVCGMNVSITLGNGFWHQFSGNSTAWLILYATAVVLIKKTLQIKDKRLKITALLLAVLFALFQVCGMAIALHQTIDILGAYWVITVLKLVGLTIFYTSILVVLFSKLVNWQMPKQNVEYPFFTQNKRSICLVTILIFICWIPYLLKYFPGITSYDSIMQIRQILGQLPLTQHHPLIHIGLIKICLDLGNFVFHSRQAGVAIYTIFQMLTMAFIFSFTLYYMARKKVGIGYRLLSLLYFAVYPTFPMLSLMMQKDTFFGGLMLFVTIILIELLTNTENFFASKIRVTISAIILLITILFRNNALYSFLMTVPFFIIFLKGNRTKVASLLRWSNRNCTDI